MIELHCNIKNPTSRLMFGVFRFDAVCFHITFIYVFFKFVADAALPDFIPPTSTLRHIFKTCIDIKSVPKKVNDIKAIQNSFFLF